MPRLLVLYDADCGFCTHSAKVLMTLDRGWLGRRRLDVRPLQSAGSIPDAPSDADLREAIHVRDPDGRWSAGGDATIRIGEAIPILWPLAAVGRLPAVPMLVDALYRLVARNRQTLSRLLGEDACRIPSSPVDSAP